MNVWKSDDFVTVFDGLGTGKANVIETFEICDDCRQAYPSPVYYTFDMDGCSTVEIDGMTPIPHECTGNLCPDCAGFCEPDTPKDPRRQELVMDPVTRVVTSTGVKP